MKGLKNKLTVLEKKANIGKEVSIQIERVVIDKAGVERSITRPVTVGGTT